MDRIIHPIDGIAGSVELPGDKSIAHRAAIFAALSLGESCIRNFPSGADCLSTLNCLAALGVEYRLDGSTLFINGVGLHGLKPPKHPLDCGNSGTTMRLLAGVLSAQNFPSVLVGDTSLSRRPMSRITEPLTIMGAKISATDGHAPLYIEPSELHSFEYRTKMASAQLKSCLLLASLYAPGTKITETTQTRDHTERFIDWLGGSSGEMRGFNMLIPGDISSAAFLIVLAIITKSSRLTIKNVGLNPTRTAFIDLLTSVGADITVKPGTASCPEPTGDIEVKSSILRHFSISEGDCAAMIDEIPALAAAACFANGMSVISGASELRHKESDRIHALLELRGLGADINETTDGLIINGGGLLGGTADSRGDHRIAMAVSIAAYAAKMTSKISNTDCVAVSFGGFYDSVCGLSNFTCHV